MLMEIVPMEIDGNLRRGRLLLTAIPDFLPGFCKLYHDLAPQARWEKDLVNRLDKKRDQLEEGHN